MLHEAIDIQELSDPAITQIQVGFIERRHHGFQIGLALRRVLLVLAAIEFEPGVDVLRGVSLVYMTNTHSMERFSNSMALMACLLSPDATPHIGFY